MDKKYLENNSAWENNTIIAEFMGFEVIKRIESMTPNEQLLYHPIDISKQELESRFEYHKNWTKLMEVIEKIENIEIDGFCPFTVEITADECLIKDIRDNSVITYQNYNTKLETTWRAVAEFLKWYRAPKVKKKYFSFEEAHDSAINTEWEVVYDDEAFDDEEDAYCKMIMPIKRIEYKTCHYDEYVYRTVCIAPSGSITQKFAEHIVEIHNEWLKKKRDIESALQV